MEENTSVQQEETQDTTLLAWGWLSYLAAFSSVGYGLYKLFVYSNSTLDILKKNAYVGGDAYNYIINGTHATTFCVIGLIFAVMGTSCFIVNAINKKK
ncbi:hypothetical protein [Pasteurella multocida]|uniref:hypothetical protein n=1 Tax=Pasteurella multocida TaxID=747 RepID=UPI002021FBC3|nr:hypothetical protein [Pasteurella multocida]MCL7818154.1 hypothetical protein [Pasteurella multocida]MEB3457959.1 hypothetical protein [Pasteurella multocida]MEB3488663.1 hypothetical protein [Pasteurella multocida]MEB3490571.1 hypothetical protein [Pasteurella multocida]URK00516.1 hypothetical protein M9414_05745 [Pasteurella multocida]